MEAEQPAWTATRDNDAKPRPTPAPVPDFRPDHRIGRFVVLRPLGEGGMGKVYVGYDEQLDRKVAIKLLRWRGAGEQAEQRLLREAQALARLSHPNVVQIHEVGTDNGAVFIAMEFIDGRTLTAWAREQTSWRARLEILTQAARGLAAAHAAGLVHRDFKPDNVLVGHDARVRVLDFGLVRSVAADSGPVAASLERSVDSVTEHTLDGRGNERSLDGSSPRSMFAAGLTAVGSLLGTPGYMAPEQHEGRPCDAAADQFGFCVTAFELLFGLRPYEGKRVNELAAAKLAGTIAAIPSDSPVPRVVRDAIVRGLSPKPSSRWPDMQALLVALEAGLERRRPWLIPLVAAGVGAAALGLGVAFHASTASEPAQCQLDESALTGVWDDSRRRAIRTAFAATSLRFEADSFEQVERSLDAWSERWLAERDRNCRTTRIAGSQSEAMLDRREVCFARQLAQFDALVDVLAAADERVVIRAARLLDELPDLGACSVEALDSNGEPRLTPERRTEVDEQFAELARARAERRLGRPQLAEQLARAAFEHGRSWDHAPLRIEAKALLARLRIDAGELADGLEQLREAVLEAERARLLDLVASLRVELARAAAGDFAQPVLERWINDEAELALERVARAHDPRAVRLLVARARVIEQAGDYEQAVAAHERAYALSKGRLDEPSRAMLRIGVATAKYRAGHNEDARAELQACLQSMREHWGPWSPDVASVEFNLGMITSDLGQPELAREHLQTAVAIDEHLWGPNSLDVARDRFALAYLGFATGELERACELSEQVASVYTRELGVEHDETAAALTSVGLCRFYADDFEGALLNYERALAIRRKLLGDAHDEVGQLHYNIAEVHLARAEFDQARAGFDQAEAIFTAKLANTHPLHALVLKGRGLLWLEQGDDQQALAALELALALADASQAVELAEIRLGLARALLRVHGEREQTRATELAEAALQTFEHAGLDSRARAARACLRTSNPNRNRKSGE